MFNNARGAKRLQLYVGFNKHKTCVTIKHMDNKPDKNKFVPPTRQQIVRDYATNKFIWTAIVVLVLCGLLALVAFVLIGQK